MAVDLTNEPTCCNCFLDHISQYYGPLVINHGEYQRVNSSAEATIEEETVVIESTLSYVHVELNHLIEVEMLAALHMTDFDAGYNPLLELPSLSLVGSDDAAISSIMGQDQQLTQHFYSQFTVDPIHAGNHHASSFAIAAEGLMTLKIMEEDCYYELTYPATAELNVITPNDGGTAELNVITSNDGGTAELNVITSNNGGTAEAEGLYQSLHPQPGTSTAKRPAATKTSKRKRSSSAEEEMDTAGGVSCTLCLDSLDAILGTGKSLHAARCGHLMCSECVQRRATHSCRSCKQPIVGTRRVYGV